MHMLDTWEQTAVFNPADPTQKKIEKYAGVPGAYATYYFNRVPTPGSLKGAFGMGMNQPVTWKGLAVAGLFAWIGLWAARKTGLNTKTKSLLRKVPMVRRMPGIAGARR